MEYDYLKSDNKRIEKKLEQLNQKYEDIENKKELEKLEKRYEEINNAPGSDLKKDIWGDIYKDVLELERKSDKKKSDKKKKSD